MRVLVFGLAAFVWLYVLVFAFAILAGFVLGFSGG